MEENNIKQIHYKLNEHTKNELELYNVLQLIVQYCLTPQGKEIILNTEFPHINILNKELQQVQELFELNTTDENFPLERIEDIRDYVKRSKIDGAVLEIQEMQQIVAIVRLAKGLKRFISPKKSKYTLLYDEISLMYEDKTLEKKLNATIDENGNIRDNATPQLSKIRAELRNSNSQLHSRMTKLVREYADADLVNDDFYTIKDGRFVLSIKASHKRRLQGIVHSASQTGATVYFEPNAVIDLNNELALLHSAELREINNILKALTKLIAVISAELLDNYAILSHLDSMNAKALYAIDNGGIKPIITNDSVIELKNMRHPLLVNKLGHKNAIPLTISFNFNKRGHLISGPNAGGKTIAMKTTGLAIMMTQLGIFPLGEARICPINVYSSIGDGQSLEQNLSTFSFQLNRLKDILDVVSANANCHNELATTSTEIYKEMPKQVRHDRSLLLNSVGFPTQRGEIPTQRGEIPTQKGEIPTQKGEIPTQKGEIPTQRGEIPTQRGEIPTQRGEIPTQRGEIPTQRGEIPTCHAELVSASTDYLINASDKYKGMPKQVRHDIDFARDDIYFARDNIDFTRDNEDFARDDNENNHPVSAIALPPLHRGEQFPSRGGVGVVNARDNNSNYLVLIDEICSGTDPREGAALASGILDTFIELGLFFIVTTHQSSLKVYALNNKNNAVIQNDSFEFDAKELKPTFVFKEGLPGNSFAFYLAKNVGFSPLLLNRAKKYLGNKHKQLERSIASLHKHKKEYEHLVLECRRQLLEAEKVKENYNNQQNKITESKNKIINDAKLEAEKILKNATDLVENTLKELKNAKKNDLEATRQFKEAKRTLAAETSEIQHAEATKKDNLQLAEHLEFNDTVGMVGNNRVGVVLEADNKDKIALVSFNGLKFRLPFHQLYLTKKVIQQAKKAIPLKLDVNTKLDLRGYRAEEALQEVDKFISDAIHGSVDFVSIIHGKGTGVLREVIHNYLKTFTAIKSFRLGEIYEGGSGATFVYFR
ncbi:MAG: Smr/MutS family protein [Bacteroidetes bacterium]|nr:Smr/MutS family protein [Bacteroidota bacterium]